MLKYFEFSATGALSVCPSILKRLFFISADLKKSANLNKVSLVSFILSSALPCSKKLSDKSVIIKPRSSLVIVILLDFTSGAKRLTAFFFANPKDFPFSKDGKEFILFPKSERRPADNDKPPDVFSVSVI